MATKKPLKFTVIIDSKHCEQKVFIECSDYDYEFDAIDKLILSTYETTTIHLGQRDVTELCRINDGIMQIRGLDDIDMRSLHG